MKNKIFNLLFVSVFFTSCSKVIIPSYTTVPEIYNLKRGMTMDRVNSTLGVGPYEFYTNFYDGNKVLVYKYKKTYQLVTLKAQDNRENLSGGSERFKNEGNLYVVFDQKTDAMEYFITTSGRKLAKRIVNESNQLRLIKADPILFRQYWNESSGLSSGYYKAISEAEKSVGTSSMVQIEKKSASTSALYSEQTAKEATPKLEEVETPAAAYKSSNQPAKKEPEIAKTPVVENESYGTTVNEVASSSNSVAKERLASLSNLVICYAVPNEADAKALSASIKSRGYGAGYFWIPDYEPEGKKFFRVYAGPYRNKESALAGLVEIKKIFPGAYYYQLK